jgi:hypothetical protein
MHSKSEYTANLQMQAKPVLDSWAQPGLALARKRKQQRKSWWQLWK